ncbi:MAG: c-type cytochrome [Gammaproteobacteria bacterium]
MRLLFVLLLLLPGIKVPAEQYNAGLARQNYILNCQGCHLSDGSGSRGGAPRMNGFTGNFLHVPGGREYIVQVPGVASAAISDADLAGVINWVLVNFSKEQLPDNFQPYTAAEVGSLRRSALINVEQVRSQLIKQIEQVLGVREEP